MPFTMPRSVAGPFRNLPRHPLARRALFFAVVHGALMFAVTALILRFQATLGDYQKPLARTSTVINRDQATNSYRRSFNVLALLLQTGTAFGAVDATTRSNSLHVILLLLLHLYNLVHAYSEYALWRFMINTYPSEKYHNSPPWAEYSLILLASIGAIVWTWFAVRLALLWGWRKGIGKYGGQEGMRQILMVHYVYCTLLRLAPLVLLGYVNRQLIDAPAAHGSSGIATDLAKVVVAFLAIMVAIVGPAYAGLQRESKGLSVFALLNVVVFLIASAIFYVAGLKRELLPKPINPWADPALHAVTILFFPMGIAMLVALMVGSVLAMRNYGKGLKELRTSQVLLGDESDNADNAPVQLEGLAHGNVVLREASSIITSVHPPPEYASSPRAAENVKRRGSVDADISKPKKSELAAPFPCSPEPSLTIARDYDTEDSWGPPQNARSGLY